MLTQLPSSRHAPANGAEGDAKLLGRSYKCNLEAQNGRLSPFDRTSQMGPQSFYILVFRCSGQATHRKEAAHAKVLKLAELA